MRSRMLLLCTIARFVFATHIVVLLCCFVVRAVRVMSMCACERGWGAWPHPHEGRTQNAVCVCVVVCLCLCAILACCMHWLSSHEDTHAYVSQKSWHHHVTRTNKCGATLPFSFFLVRADLTNAHELERQNIMKQLSSISSSMWIITIVS